MKTTNPFIAAFYFLTSLPVTRKEVPFEAVARGLWTFPFIGVCIGIFLSLVSIPGSLVLPPLLLPGVILLIWVWITGALHLDGFIDCCDGLLAPKTKEERLLILKDVATGSFGVVGAILLLLIKFLALASISIHMLPIILVMSATAGRSAILYVMFRFPYAREKGLGKIFKSSITLRDIIISLAVLSGIAGICFFFYSRTFIGFILIGSALICCEVFGFWVLKRIPGFTGDVYGAACELVETVTLVTAAAALKVVI